MTKHSTKLAMAGLLAIFVTPFATHADDFSVSMGLGAGVGPAWEGSDSYQGFALPILSLDWEAEEPETSGGTDILFGFHSASLGFPSGLTAELLRIYRPEGLYSLELGAAYGGGRDQDDGDDNELRGMGDIDASPYAMINLGYEMSDSGLSIGLGIEQDVGSETDSTLATLSAGYAVPVTEGVILTPNLSGTWADDDHMQSYFGVNARQAAASGNQRFDAEAGIKSVRIGLDAVWLISENWMLNSGLGYSRLTSDAADSPLVKNRGSANQGEFFLGVSYMF